jgi:hypothetical protein
MSKAEKSSYWKVREEIARAALTNDDVRLNELAKKYPRIFQEMLNQAKNHGRRSQLCQQIH